jgi:hypothetical protein
MLHLAGVVLRLLLFHIQHFGEKILEDFVAAHNVPGQDLTAGVSG